MLGDFLTELRLSCRTEGSVRNVFQSHLFVLSFQCECHNMDSWICYSLSCKFVVSIVYVVNIFIQFMLIY